MATQGRAQLAQTYGWLPNAALDVFIESYLESGDANAGWAAVRQDSRYEAWFPGNLTDDGRPRYTESAYAQAIAGYEEAFKTVGLNPDVFRGRFANLIRGDVDPEELLLRRLMPARNRIVDASESIKADYAQRWGLELTDAALLAGFIDPDVGTEILENRISMSEIGGEAAESGFNIQSSLVDRLFRAGVDREAADELFMAAENFVPVLNVLASRHADPDDAFDLEEFVSATQFQDPLQNRRMRRLVAQERATFTGGGMGAFARDRAGAVAGLNRPV